MNAIQRWFFWDHGQKPHESTDGDVLEDLWCKAKDVETLESLVAESTQKAMRARADRTIADDLVKSLRAEIIDKDIEITNLRYLINTHECGDPEDCHP